MFMLYNNIFIFLCNENLLDSDPKAEVKKNILNI